MSVLGEQNTLLVHWNDRETGVLRGFSEDQWVLIAQCLLLLNLIAITRAFALVSLIEFILWCLFLFYPPLRLAFFEVFSDIRIKLVFVFWGWVALATAWSPADYVDRFEEVWSWRKLVLFPMAWVLFSNPQLKRVAMFTLITTAGVYMLFSWAGHLGYIALDRPASQLLENHATQGVVFLSACLMMIILLKSGSLNVWFRVLFYVLITGMVSNIVFVLTGRTSYMSLILLAPYSIWIWVAPNRNRWLPLVAVGITVLVALYTSDLASSRIEQGLNEFRDTMSGGAEKPSSMGLRWVFWENTVQMILESPVVGSGSGGFSIEYAKIVAGHHGWRALVTDDPHQQYLLIAAEQGLVGLCLFVAILWALLMSGRGTLYGAGAIGLLLMTILNGMYNGHFNSFVEGRLFWIMMAVLLSSSIALKTFTDLLTHKAMRH